MKTHKPKTIQEAINDLEVFLVSDMPSKVFPIEKLKGEIYEREDYFTDTEEIKEYLKEHFEILNKQIEELK